MSSYKEAMAECPFYKRDDCKARRITCEGVADASSLDLYYQSKDKFELQVETFCCDKYQNCEVYQMLMQAYEDAPCGYKTSFTIDYPATAKGKRHWASEYGTNAYYAGKHHRLRCEDVNYWHMLTIAALSKAKIRRRPFDKPVVITFYWDDNLDIDNHSIMGKMIVDALKGRLLRDDTRQWVKGVTHLFHEASYVRVVLQEVSE